MIWFACLLILVCESQALMKKVKAAGIVMDTIGNVYRCKNPSIILALPDRDAEIGLNLLNLLSHLCMTFFIVLRKVQKVPPYAEGLCL